MALFYYATVGDEVGAELLRNLTQATPQYEIETFGDLDSFSARLRSWPTCMSIAVLFVATREELATLRSIKHLLEDTRVLLVLPDANPETVRLAHELTPRFLAYVDNDFMDLAAVLKKMLGNQARVTTQGNCAGAPTISGCAPPG